MNRAAFADLIAVGEGVTTEFMRSDMSGVGWRFAHSPT